MLSCLSRYNAGSKLDATHFLVRVRTCNSVPLAITSQLSAAKHENNGKGIFLRLPKNSCSSIPLQSCLACLHSLLGPWDFAHTISSDSWKKSAMPLQTTCTFPIAR